MEYFAALLYFFVIFYFVTIPSNYDATDKFVAF